jgi:hypothetical protein
VEKDDGVIRSEVITLAGHSPLAGEGEYTVETLEPIQTVLHEIDPPLTR